jgi:hypothetical protein
MEKLQCDAVLMHTHGHGKNVYNGRNLEAICKLTMFHISNNAYGIM